MATESMQSVVKFDVPLKALCEAQRSAAMYLEAAYLNAVEFPDMASMVRMNAVRCRAQQQEATALVVKFRNTSRDVLDTLMPNIREAAMEGDSDLVQANVELAIEWALEMEKDCEKTKENYRTIALEVNKSIAKASSKKVEREKRKEQIESERKELKDIKDVKAQHEKKFQMKSDALQKEVESLRQRRDKLRAQSDKLAKKEEEERSGDLFQMFVDIVTPDSSGSEAGVFDTVVGAAGKVLGSLSKLVGIKSEAEKAAEKAAGRTDAAQAELMENQRRVEELMQEVTKTQLEIAQHDAQIRHLEIEDMEITEQAPFLQAASDNLGKVDRILAMCTNFWSSIGAACQKMKKQMDVPRVFVNTKKKAMIDDKEMQKKFVKIFDKGAKYWEAFVAITDEYLQEEGGLELYNFLDGKVDFVSRTQRKDRLEVLNSSIAALTAKYALTAGSH